MTLDIADTVSTNGLIGHNIDCDNSSPRRLSAKQKGKAPIRVKYSLKRRPSIQETQQTDFDSTSISKSQRTMVSNLKLFSLTTLFVVEKTNAIERKLSLIDLVTEPQISGGLHEFSTSPGPSTRSRTAQQNSLKRRLSQLELSSSFGFGDPPVPTQNPWTAKKPRGT